MYKLLNVYPIRPWESWTIRTHVVHAPGPWLTFEIQKPLDDYNLLAWHLGQPAPDEELVATKEAHQVEAIMSWSMGCQTKGFNGVCLRCTRSAIG
jgi:hypothetical protein